MEEPARPRRTRADQRQKSGRQKVAKTVTVLGIDALNEALRAKLEGRQTISLDDRRKAVDAISEFGAPGQSFEVDETEIAGVPTVKFLPDTVQGEGAIVHAHGGAFVAGSARSHQYLAGSLAQMVGRPVYVPNYRLAPEAPFPAALDDVLAVVRDVARAHGRASKVALSGDSAGGALILSTACRLRDEDSARLAGLAFLSPFVDLTCENETYERLACVDPFIQQAGLSQDVTAYLGGADPRDPMVSPAFANLAGLPPMLIQVGANEVLLGDAEALKAAAEAANVTVHIHVWPDMIHVWHLFPRFVTEADAAIRELSDFLADRLPAQA